MADPDRFCRRAARNMRIKIKVILQIDPRRSIQARHRQQIRGSDRIQPNGRF